MKYFTDHSNDIKKFEHWTLTLNTNQSYLGRTICYLNTYKESLVELTRDEYLELLEIIREYQNALTQLWQPDWWNYSQLGNATPHLHIHFIPRYKGERTFDGVAFIDERLGGHYAPASQKSEDKDLNEKIKLAIQKALPQK